MSILNKIRRLEQEYKSLLPMKLEYQKRFDEKMRLEFNYNSNHIEGNTLTYIETKALLLKDLAPTTNKTFHELEEMKGHDVAFDLVKSWATDHSRPLTEQDIKDLNRLLLVKPFNKDAITPEGRKVRRLIRVGDYKEQPNSVLLDNGETFEYASPRDTPIKMGELMNWWRQNEQKEGVHPIELATVLHHRFVLIHPFDDGNGRISRLLVNYVLLKNGLPPVVVKTDDKKAYLNALRLADTGNMVGFVQYMAQQLEWSLEKAIAAANGQNIEDDDDVDKELDLLIKKAKSRDDIEIVEKEKSIIYDLYANSYKKLIRAYFKAFGKLEQLFAKTEYETTINGSGANGSNNDYLDNRLTLWNQKSEEFRKEHDLNEPWSSFGAAVHFDGFLNNGIDAFSCSSSFKIHFERYYYYINTTSSRSFVKKAYTQQLTQDEIKEIVKQDLKWTMDYIKNMIA